jgi:hypothetical protein
MTSEHDKFLKNRTSYFNCKIKNTASYLANKFKNEPLVIRQILAISIIRCIITYITTKTFKEDFDKLVQFIENSQIVDDLLETPIPTEDELAKYFPQLVCSTTGTIYHDFRYEAYAKLTNPSGRDVKIGGITNLTIAFQIDKMIDDSVNHHYMFRTESHKSNGTSEFMFAFTLLLLASVPFAQKTIKYLEDLYLMETNPFRLFGENHVQQS